MDIDQSKLIFAGAVLLAVVSVAFFVMPFLKEQERKKHFREVIEKKRRTMRENIEKEQNKKAGDIPTATQSLATLYWVEKVGGAMASQHKAILMQAGIRNPKAPVYLLVAQIIGPFFMMGIALYLNKVAGISMGSFMDLVGLIVAVFLGYKLPVLIIGSRAKERRQEINIAFPDALDLMLICVQGGIGLEQTVQRVSEEMMEYSEIVAEELGLLSAEMAVLSNRRDALQSFADRVGTGAGRTFATALIQAEQYGTSVGQALRVLASELRDQRMMEAERKAAALPPKLTVPMILFFLPALFVVIAGPASIQVGEM